MEKKRKSATREQDSLIPVVKGEEKRLDELLQEARERAAKIVAEAEREAAERLATAEADVPVTLARERETRLTAIRETAAKVRAEAAGETRTLEKAAMGRLPAAVTYILSRVRPGSRP
jgi:vacuolar-type H+-ATPase subunit H